MIKRLILDKTEHLIKHLGTIMSGVYALIIGFLLLYLDFRLGNFRVLGSSAMVLYQRLVPVINVLVSIVIGISLTTFSVIFVVMQLASSQFSPRILRHFLANDMRVQHFIAVFVGTVALCVLPQLASVFLPSSSFLVTLSIGAFFAMRSLVWSYPSMITYLSVHMNISSITNQIKIEMVDEINDLYKQNWEIGNPLLYKRKIALKTETILKIICPLPSGYLESVNYLKLEKLLLPVMCKYNIIQVYQKPIVGEYLMQDTTVVLMVNVANPSDELHGIFQKIVAQCFNINVFRSHTQDINFGVRKLVDIAIKAISPAVNDPTTCINCIDQIGEILKHLSDKRFPSTNARHLISKNIHINEFNYDEFVDFCFDQIFQWGKYDPTVIKRILRSLRTILPFVDNPFHLKTLIKEVEDMELLTIYDQKTMTVSISKEKIETIQLELKGFREKALQQIAVIEQKGVLDYYLGFENANENIQKEQVSTIEYLLQYKQEKGSH